MTAYCVGCMLMTYLSPRASLIRQVWIARSLPYDGDYLCVSHSCSVCPRTPGTGPRFQSRFTLVHLRATSRTDRMGPIGESFNSVSQSLSPRAGNISCSAYHGYGSDSVCLAMLTLSAFRCCYQAHVWRFCRHEVAAEDLDARTGTRQSFHALTKPPTLDSRRENTGMALPRHSETTALKNIKCRILDHGRSIRSCSSLRGGC